MSKQLILLHPDGKEVPSGTADWLAPRKLDMHHHIRTNRPGDFDRLARLLGDRAVGLVLSGGGARGLAHIGGYWAIREAGIPIDMIGGTSMGAIMGALCAMGFSRVQMMDHARRALIDAKPFGAYALPFISIVQSHRIEAAFADIYGDTHIEDLWLNFFAVSSNLTQHQMMIHQEGPLTEALRASSSLPGVLPPLQKDGHLLIDGGLLNNLPGDIMNKYCQKVIALDVTPSKKTKTTLPSQPTGLGWLWRRLRSKTKVNFPGILEILLGATMLSSTRHAKEVRESADFYHKLPVDDFGLLEFTALPTLVEIGYLTTEAALAKIDLIQWPTTRTFRPRSVTKPLLNK